MPNTISYRALIRGIEKAYFKVCLIVLHKRMNSYHRVASHQTHANDITSPLQECVDIIVGYALDNPNVVYSVGHNMDKYTTPHLSNDKNKQATTLPTQINQEHIKELSKYFKARSTGSGLHPSIQEKLEHSIWDHVHATLRCARLGDDHCSKMHANIACCACKELAHYMDEYDYHVFIVEVEDHLNTLKSDNPNKSL